MKRVAFLFLAVLLALSMTVPSFALTAVTVETSEEFSIPQTDVEPESEEEPEAPAKSQAVLSSDSVTVSDSAVTDVNKGILIFKQDFEEAHTDKIIGNYTDLDYPIYVDGTYVTDATTVLPSDVDSEAVTQVITHDDSQVLSITGAAPLQYRIQFGSNGIALTQEGDFTMSYRMKPQGEATIASIHRLWAANQQGSGYYNNGSISDVLSTYNLDAAPGKWTELSVKNYARLDDGVMTFGTASKMYPNHSTVDTDDWKNYGMTKITNINVFSNQSTAGSFYLDDVNIHFYPLNAFMFYLDDQARMVSGTGTYTIPELSELYPNSSATVYAWTDKTNIYMPGDVVNISEMSHKTLTPITVPLYSENRGELAFFVDYDIANATTTSFTYRNPLYVSGDTFSYRNDGLINTDETKVVTDGTNGYLKLVPKNAGGYRMYQIYVKKQISGLFGFDYKIMSENFAGLSNYVTTRFNAYTHLANSSDTYAATDAYVADFADNTWNFVSGTTTKENLENRNMKTGIDEVGPVFSQDTGVSDPIYFDDFALYIYPENTLMYKDSATGTNFKLDKEHFADGMYTFPTPEELGYSVENFLK